MAAVDSAAPEPLSELIERAGTRVAWAARRMLGGVYGRRVSVLAGPGNNGADARVAAERLERWGVRVRLLDATTATRVESSDLVIDGGFGTGMNRPYEPLAIPTGTPVLAIDIPSGVDGCTGAISGGAIVADCTISFAALKPGLLLHPGAAHCGTVELADIGLDVSGATAWLFTESDARRLFPRRSSTAHKWNRAVLGRRRVKLACMARRCLRRGPPCGQAAAWCAVGSRAGGACRASRAEVVFADLQRTAGAR